MVRDQDQWVHGCTSVASSVDTTSKSVSDITRMFGMDPKQVYKVNSLRDRVIKMPKRDLVDKLLPAHVHCMVPRKDFTPD